MAVTLSSALGRGPRKMCLSISLIGVAMMAGNLLLIGRGRLFSANDLVEGWVEGSFSPPATNSEGKDIGESADLSLISKVRAHDVSSATLSSDEQHHHLNVSASKLLRPSIIHQHEPGAANITQLSLPSSPSNTNYSTQDVIEKSLNITASSILTVHPHNMNTTQSTIPSNTSTIIPQPQSIINQSKAPLLQGTATIQLYGELGNNLSILAHYFAMKTIAQTEFNLHLNLHVRKQKSSKAESAANNTKCIKSFSKLDFDECEWSQVDNGTQARLCDERIGKQMGAFHELMMATNNSTFMQLATSSLQIRGSTSNEIRSLLRGYVSMLKDDAIMEMYQTNNNLGWSAEEPYPFLFSVDRLFASDVLINEFYSQGLPEYFAFDDKTKISSGCCSMLPEKDEQVFHYRSFILDLPKRHLSWGGAELTPSNAANLLAAARLPPGTKVVLVSGRSTVDRVEAYKEAFANKSFIVRQISGQSSIQDFCFLAHARAGLWGTIQSSYVTWASLISKGLQNATLYGVNYPAREQHISGRVPTNKKLSQILHYPVFHVSDEDVW